jgi:hypothetical protein
MTLAGFQCTYEFVLEGLRLMTSTPISVPAWNLEAMLSDSEPPRLSIRIAGANDSAAATRAERFAEVVYRQILLRCCTALCPSSRCSSGIAESRRK